jgi:hypothetical protein
MKKPQTYNIVPIDTAIRDATRQLSDAEWSEDQQQILRATAVLESLKSQQARGEQYAVPF